jgi:hypothetical protein
MPYDGQDVPHAVIEVNQRCNISCVACYKDKSTYEKPLAQILEEIDLVLRERRVGVLSIAGGEPTLHPDLPAVIDAVARRGVQAQLLTNGLRLDDDMLRAYAEAGLKRVYLHIDSLQKRPDARGARSEADLHPLREAIAERVVKAGLRCALTVTLYRTRNLADLPGVVEHVLDSPWLDRLLVTCCTDFGAIDARLRERHGLPVVDAEPGPDLRGEVVSNAEVERALSRLGMTPFAYVASDRDLAARRWLFYYAFTSRNARGEVKRLHFDATFGRIASVANGLARQLRGRYPFGETLEPAAAMALCAAYAAASMSVRTALETFQFLAGAAQGDITQKSFIFQQGPSVTADGEVEICKDCPDATVRNGRVVPVCLADLVSPLAEA